MITMQIMIKIIIRIRIKIRIRISNDRALDYRLYVYLLCGYECFTVN